MSKIPPSAINTLNKTLTYRFVPEGNLPTNYTISHHGGYLTNPFIKHIFSWFSHFLTEEFTVALVKVKEKYQVTLPADIRKKADVNVGDLLEAKVQGKKITLVPKVPAGREFIEKRLAEADEDIRKGRVSPAFSSAKAAVRYLHRQARKLKKA